MLKTLQSNVLVSLLPLLFTGAAIFSRQIKACCYTKKTKDKTDNGEFHTYRFSIISETPSVNRDKIHFKNQSQNSCHFECNTNNEKTNPQASTHMQKHPFYPLANGLCTTPYDTSLHFITKC